MERDTNRPDTAAAARVLSRQAATAVAAGRVALGVAALARPSELARPWVGAVADEPAAQVLGRALGARDLALGLGALATVRKPPSGRWEAAVWYAAGTLSDVLDVAITAAAWPRLPRGSRWLIAAAAAGAAIAGIAGTLATAVK